MDKPLEYWTLGEIRKHCKGTTCEECFIYELYGGECDFAPNDWGLIELPRWSQEDIEDAKAIKRVHPYALAVERRENYANPLVLTNGRGNVNWAYPGLISSLKPGECVDLQEILDAEGKA